MIASAAQQVDLGRSAGPDLDDEAARPAPEPTRTEPAPASTQPVVQAYAAEQPRTIAAQSPLLAAATTTSSAAGVPVRGVRLPPSRPFDLDTIANAGKPVPVLRPATVTAPMPVPRASFTSMKAHSQQSLARN